MQAPSLLRFADDRRFRIVQFTDIHLGANETDDRRTLELMDAVLDAEQPALVVLTGDVLEGELARDPARATREAVEPMERRGIPWAAVFGNHDDEGALSRADLLEVQRSCPGCLCEAGPQELPGLGNFTLDVASAGSDAAAALLYFLDTRAYSRTGAGDYDWISYEQVGWYRDLSRLRNAERDEPLPALLFLHIPLPEYATAWEHGYDVRGTRREHVNAPVVNSGLFAALHERGDVLGVFAGHDHLNDFEASLHGIRLCYGLATGYGGYGREDLPRGARVIELREGERGFDTWLRLADGRAVRQAQRA